MNSHLTERQIDENKLGFELSSGVALNELLAALEGHSLGKFHKEPKLRYHKIENLDFVLGYLKKSGEQLVGQDAHGMSFLFELFGLLPVSPTAAVLLCNPSYVLCCVL